MEVVKVIKFSFLSESELQSALVAITEQGV